jgi:hypothetical protein
MGVKPDMVISATFIIGAVLAAVAGVMWAANYGTVQHSMGFLPGLKAFTAAVLGGIGNLAGAVVGGILLGLVEAIGAGYLGELTGGVLGSHYADIFAFVALILVLTLRPAGPAGRTRGRPGLRRRHAMKNKIVVFLSARAGADGAAAGGRSSSARAGCASWRWRCCTCCWRWA